ncbi:MAG: radical SAM protein [Endomicrobiaceae bacterium]
MKSIAWDIWLYCNYDCKFCNTKTKILPDKIKDAGEILDAWRNIYKRYGRCRIYITGGEPFIYPGIFEIIQKLSDLHDVHITTNLSFDVNKLVSNKINKKNIFINATFHPFFVSFDKFISDFIKVKDKGYKISAGYMCDDSQAAEMLNYKKAFASYGVIMTPSVYNGGKAYNEAARRFAINGNFTCDDIEKDSIINSTAGGYCDAGKSYACVNDKGDAFICSVKRDCLGNIFDGTFRFSEKSVKCVNKCLLQENKYSQKDIL